MTNALSSRETAVLATLLPLRNRRVRVSGAGGSTIRTLGAVYETAAIVDGTLYDAETLVWTFGGFVVEPL